jgi:S1-C subfamily serine protease
MLQVTSLQHTVGAAVITLGRGARRGSGLVIAENHVIAMAHSLPSEQLELQVGGEAQAGTVAGTDRASGIALISVPTDGIAAITWAEKTPQIGDVVFALGNPGSGLRITEGRVSAAPLSFRGRGGRLIEGIEHTAPLPRGSGGGPLVDQDGAVVGLNTLRTDPGLLFAIGTATVRAAVERLLAGEAETGWLGVAIVPPRVTRRLRRAVGLAERDGLLVRGVEDGSPAATAGVQIGDLLVGLGDQDLDSVDALFAALDANSGNEAALRVVRGIEELELPVTLTGARK